MNIFCVRRWTLFSLFRLENQDCLPSLPIKTKFLVASPHFFSSQLCNIYLLKAYKDDTSCSTHCLSSSWVQIAWTTNDEMNRTSHITTHNSSYDSYSHRKLNLLCWKGRTSKFPEQGQTNRWIIREPNSIFRNLMATFSIHIYISTTILSEK